MNNDANATPGETKLDEICSLTLELANIGI